MHPRLGPGNINNFLSDARIRPSYDLRTILNTPQCRQRRSASSSCELPQTSQGASGAAPALRRACAAAMSGCLLVLSACHITS